MNKMYRNGWKWLWNTTSTQPPQNGGNCEANGNCLALEISWWMEVASLFHDL